MDIGHASTQLAIITARRMLVLSRWFKIGGASLLACALERT